MKQLLLRGTALVGLFNIQLPGLSVFVTPVAAADKCQPYVWGDPSHDFAVQVADDEDSPPPKVGEVNCRQKDTSPGSVNYYTCTQMADKHDIDVERFFLINPNLKKDCSNIQPKTKYCVDGFIEPLRAFDGKCGPRNNNATCLGTDKQCCNSGTFTCGDNYEIDCAPGICWEGACSGDKVWSTDGTCGAKHGNRQCAGKWGSCCSFEGKCGSGPGFCGKDVCQSGDCTQQNPGNGGGGHLPWQTGNSTDGTCGGPKAYTCKVIYGNCCNRSGKCGSLPQDCGEGCQPKFGKCGTGRN